MKKKCTPHYELIRRLFWPLVSLLLVCYFVIVPIVKVGFWTYLGMESQVNPITQRIANKYLSYRQKKMSKEWYDRIVILEEKDIPQIEWEQDTLSSKGMDSFYCLDQQADDIRPLLMKEWGLPTDNMLWWNAKQTGEYFFEPDISPLPIYNMERSDSTLHIKTGTKLDTWVYLVAKQKQPEVYKLEFDFITHTQTKETLQICFAANSLASRFRFLLESNQTLGFQVVDHAMFFPMLSNHKFPYSLPLHKVVHVELVCVNNMFALYFDNHLVMAVMVRDYDANPSYWYLIFWNGTSEHKTEQDQHMDIEMSNLKIFHKSN